MQFTRKKNGFVLCLFSFVLLSFVSIPVHADVAILDNLVSQGVQFVTLDGSQTYQERAKGLQAYLNLRSGGAINFISAVSRLKTDTRMEKIVTGIASETYTNDVNDVFYDNATKRELWRHNTSTNTIRMYDTMKGPVIHWYDYRSDGGFSQLFMTNVIFRLPRTVGPGAFLDYFYMP